MKVTRLSSLFSSISDRYQVAANTQEQYAAEVEAEQVRSDEAARLSSDLAAEESGKRDKIERLKQEIQAGSYNPDPREVATAVLKELGSI